MTVPPTLMSDKIFLTEGSMSGGKSGRDNGGEGHLGGLIKGSMSRMIGIGSCDGGDDKKTVSKSRTGRSTSNGLEEIPVSFSSYLSVLVLTCQISLTNS